MKRTIAVINEKDGKIREGNKQYYENNFTLDEIGLWSSTVSLIFERGYGDKGIHLLVKMKFVFE